MSLRTATYGQLECRVIDHTASHAASHRAGGPALAVVLCHGFGAPADDLVGIGHELVRRSQKLRENVCFVFPGAPLRLDAMGMFGGRAWWPLDVARINRLIATGRVRDLSSEEPEGLAPARRQLQVAVDLVLRQANLAPSQLILGGFSQGAMLTTDLSLRLEDAPAGLCALSGTLLNATTWRQLAAKRRGLPVFQSHGRADQLLPFALADELRSLLDEAGLDVAFHPFEGMHEIPPSVLDALQSWLEAMVP